METCGPCECKIWYPRLAVMCLGFEEATNPAEFTFGLNTSSLLGISNVNIRIQKYVIMPIYCIMMEYVPTEHFCSGKPCFWSRTPAT